MAQKIYTVTQINTYIKNVFDQDYLLGRVSVSGEISNLKYHSSGHIYFTLKETSSSIACVMFASARRSLNFRLLDGQKLIVRGKVSVFERNGSYQLYADSIALDGEGQLYLEFEHLKEKLFEMGMFDESYKRPIPGLVKTLGVITAPTGAAIHDIINVSLRRNPYIQIVLYPALVQGPGSVESLINGIKVLEKEKTDVIILGRGGGSIEDLWSFNDENVARAVFNCSTPIISAVGHETDITISDYVADRRAPTPSVAAEIAVCDILSIINTINDKRNELQNKMKVLIERKRWFLQSLEQRLDTASPVRKIRDKRMLLIMTEERLSSLMDKKIIAARNTYKKYADDLWPLMEQFIKNKRIELKRYADAVNNLSPSQKLASGYAFITDDNNKKIISVDDVNINEKLTVRIKDGTLETIIKRKNRL